MVAGTTPSVEVSGGFQSPRCLEGVYPGSALLAWVRVSRSSNARVKGSRTAGPKDREEEMVNPAVAPAGQ